MKDLHDNFAVLADDLTGALDCAAAFLSSGFSPFVSISLKVPRDAGFDLLSLNMDTRRLDHDEAKAVILKSTVLIREIGARPVYVKIDSTLRGHPGLEISEIASAFSSERTLVSPAFPATGRTVENGTLLLDGEPLAQTEVGRDPLSPATSSRVAEILARHGSMPISEAHFGEVRSGELAKRVIGNVEDGPQLICCDAETDKDLSEIAIAGLKSSMPLFAGSAGLAGALSAEMNASSANSSDADVELADGPILLVTASQRSLADRQIEHASTAMKLRAFPVGFSVDASYAISQIEFDRDTAKQAMLGGENLALRASISGKAFSSEPSRIREMADSVTSQLSLLVADLCDSRKPSAVILIGGDTAFSLMTALGADGIFLISQPLPGVPVGAIHGGALDGSVIATKAGAFGDEATVTNLLKYFLKHRTNN